MTRKEREVLYALEDKVSALRLAVITLAASLTADLHANIDHTKVVAKFLPSTGSGP